MATQALIPGRQNVFQRFERRGQLPALPPRRCLGAKAVAHPARPLPNSSSGEEYGRKVLELLPLVRKAALTMRRRLPVHVEVDDLVGAGVLGLLDAVRKFDARKRVKIESYARHRIRGAILDGLRTLDPASRDLRQKNKKMEKSLRELELKLGRSAADEEVAQALGMSLLKWHRTVNELQAAGVEWLRPMQATGWRQVAEDSLPDENQKSQFELCYRQEQRQILRWALQCLPERDRRIMLLYYGQEMTMKQIGAQLGIDESRVSQLHSATLGRLRSSVKGMVENPKPRCLPAREAPGREWTAA